MKTIVNLTAYILILLGLYSCNDDVFVDDFRTSDTEFTLDGNGDEVTIRFCILQLGFGLDVYLR